MRIKLIFLLFILIISCHSGSVAQTNTLVLNAGNPLFEVPADLWGLFFEDINFAADGGIYAEMVKNRSFEFYNPMMGWKQVEENAKGSVQVQNRTGEENPRFIRLIKSGKDGRFGIVNEGFRGMYAKEGNTYFFSVLARNPGGPVPTLSVELVGQDNKTIGKTNVSGITGEWKKYETSFQSSATDFKATLRVMIADECAVDIDFVSLFPADTWKSRKNGLRADLVQLLADIKPGFLRFPGGCIVEGHELATRYQWKKTVGPVENRHQIVNRWNTEFSYRNAPDYYQSFGLGFYEYFLLCEDIGAEPLPIINCGMACQYNTAELVPLDELDPYIDDILDLVEFANGASTSEWGRVRTAMGHPEPFHLKYLGVGNEQWGPQYVERLEIFKSAIKKTYPGILLVGGSGPSSEGKEFDYLWGKMKNLGADLVDEHYYRPPEWFLNNAGRYDHYDRQGPKIFAGEYAAHSKYQTDQPESRNNWEAALAEAAFLTGIERNCDIVSLASYAPLFGQVDAWQWRPDLIWFDNHRCAGTPDYYVQKLYSNNKGSFVISALYNNQPLTGQDSLYASATLDKASGEIIVKLVNVASVQKDIRIALQGAKPVKNQVKISMLRSDNPAAFNSLDHPDVIKPVEKTMTISGRNPLIPLESRSFSVLRIPVK